MKRMHYIQSILIHWVIVLHIWVRGHETIQCPRQNSCHLADDILKLIFMYGRCFMLNQISLKFDPKDPINNKPALAQVTTWPSQYEDAVLPIFFIKIRRSQDGLIFVMGMPITRKDDLYVKTGPWCRTGNKQLFEPILVYVHLQLFNSLRGIALYIAHFHDDVIKWNHFPRCLPFVQGIHRSPVNSPHKGQWRGALVCSLFCAWINGWVNNRAYYDVTAL